MSNSAYLNTLMESLKKSYHVVISLRTLKPNAHQADKKTNNFLINVNKNKLKVSFPNLDHQTVKIELLQPSVNIINFKFIYMNVLLKILF